VISLPWYSRGSIEFFMPDRGTCFSGDALVTLNLLTRRRPSCLAGPSRKTDSRQALASLDWLKGLQAELLLPGHGDPWRGSIRAGSIAPPHHEETQMEISRNAATAKGPAETFTGDVWVDPITRGLPPSPLNVAAVRFAPRARTAWHSHDGGQTLYVTEGRGLVQARGQQITELNPGDVVFAPDGEEHWHGARPDHFMTHLSITEGAPHWGPHVTDDEYQGQDLPGE
jgi:quercetin dioxygenase-like cupin family protein